MQREDRRASGSPHCAKHNRLPPTVIVCRPSNASAVITPAWQPTNHVCGDPSSRPPGGRAGSSLLAGCESAKGVFGGWRLLAIAVLRKRADHSHRTIRLRSDEAHACAGSAQLCTVPVDQCAHGNGEHRRGGSLEDGRWP